MWDEADSVGGRMRKLGRKLENIGTGMESRASHPIRKEKNPLVTQRSAEAVLSLSARLREQTAPLHREIEVVLGLPGAIRTRDDYQDWLARFLGLYDPLERLLATFSEWDQLGLSMSSRDHTGCLVGDIVALGIDPRLQPRAPPALLPDLPTFAHVLGALYVIEGATLGGRLILRDLEPRLGASIAGATRFFGGRGEAVGPMWQSFRAALDEFGFLQPELCIDVVTGAERAFSAMRVWFSPFCAGKVGLP
jgi:heme oxygenase